ncbi:hypothetical protein [Rhodobacter maris]|uniref:Uncharacterized protein n=1 Tax=Rhodobacter maris TaxID=446682 RepID=A0A285RVR0_9RHOB|nr:hypothetical protein [Rhodobacter maris]SOB98563.1 hypothetical protein SAMN05877831_10214 [Rhodobacter maris]
MALLDDLAEALAADVMAAQRELGEKGERLFMEVGNYIGTSSPSLQEAFMTACRLHMAADRGRTFFETRVKALKGE